MNNEPASKRLESFADSVARRLRAVGLWTNGDGDAYRSIADRVRTLETTAAPSPVANDVRRPLKSWDDAEAVLRAIIAMPHGIESGWRFLIDPAGLVWLARAFGFWRKAYRHDPPKDVRVIRFGDVVVEWPKGSIMLTRAGIVRTGDVPDLVEG